MARNTRNFQKTLTTAIQLIAQYHPERTTLIIRNDSGSTVYIGIDPTDTATSMVSLATGAARTWYRTLGDNLDRPFYGLVTAATATISIEDTLEDNRMHERE